MKVDVMRDERRSNIDPPTPATHYNLTVSESVEIL